MGAITLQRVTGATAKAQGIVTVLYGNAGSLKSTTLSLMPSPMIGQYALRGGLNRVADAMPVYNLNTVGDVVSFKHLLTAKDAGPYTTVGLDDIDLLMQDAINEKKGEKPSNKFMPYVQVYEVMSSALHQIMMLKAQGKHVVITCGAQVKKGVALNEGSGREVAVDVVKPNFPTSFWKELSRLVDIIGYCAAFPDGSVRMLTRNRVTTTRSIEAKCTLGIGLDEVVMLGTSVAGNEFAKKFGV